MPNRAIIAAAVAAGALGAGWALFRRRRAFPLRGATVLLTGSRGLGFALARELLRHGARVALLARNGEELERAAALLRPSGDVITVVADLADPAAPAAAVAEVERRWGPVEVLIHNAGVMTIGPWETMDEADFRTAMDVHYWAAVRLAQAVLPGMIARRRGRIVNLSSIGGLVAVPHMLPYTASKFALVGFTQGLRVEVARHGVGVTCVCPWLMRTGSQENVRVKGDWEREYAWFAASGSLPLMTQSAGRAARRIVRACRYGEAHLTLALAGKLLAAAHGLAPSVMTNLMSVANRFLPAAPASGGRDARSGADSYNSLTGKFIRPRVRQAGGDLNQKTGR